MGLMKKLINTKRCKYVNLISLLIIPFFYNFAHTSDFSHIYEYSRDMDSYYNALKEARREAGGSVSTKKIDELRVQHVQGAEQRFFNRHHRPHIEEQLKALSENEKNKRTRDSLGFEFSGPEARSPASHNKRATRSSSAARGSRGMSSRSARGRARGPAPLENSQAEASQGEGDVIRFSSPSDEEE